MIVLVSEVEKDEECKTKTKEAGSTRRIDGAKIWLERRKEKPE